MTSAFSAATNVVTTTTGAGRTSTATLDAKGRVVTKHVPGLTDVQLAYDGNGRVATVTQGSRVYTLSYNAAGRLASVTDPMSRTVSYTYDGVGRTLTKTLPDGQVIQFTYDMNGNVSTLTPPGKTAHAFAVTSRDQTQSYTPPAPGTGTWQTQYAYNLDGQPTTVTRPDGAAAHLRL